jgi:hypothetical protein
MNNKNKDYLKLAGRLYNTKYSGYKVSVKKELSPDELRRKELMKLEKFELINIILENNLKH